MKITSIRFKLTTLMYQFSLFQKLNNNISKDLNKFNKAKASLPLLSGTNEVKTILPQNP